MPRVLITGAKGFVGVHLTNQLLLNGWDLFGYNLRASDEKTFFKVKLQIVLR